MNKLVLALDNETKKFKFEIGNSSYEGTVPRAGVDLSKPNSWRETSRDCNRIAMQIVVNIFRAVRDTILAFRNLILGIGNLPSDLGSRIRRPKDVCIDKEPVDLKGQRQLANQETKQLTAPEKM